jgi:hypothetical protein
MGVVTGYDSNGARFLDSFQGHILAASAKAKQPNEKQGQESFSEHGGGLFNAHNTPQQGHQHHYF